MKPQFVIAVNQDLSVIVAIYNQAIPTRVATADLELVSVESKQAWFASFDPEYRPIWLIKVDGKAVGWVSLESFYGRPAYHKTVEISIYFDQMYQRQGLGQQTLDFIKSQLQHLEIDTVVAYVFGHNQASQRLFKQNGFEQWGHLPKVASLDGVLRDLDILGRHYY